jgi:hypothetical protein
LERGGRASFLVGCSWIVGAGGLGWFDVHWIM